MINSIEAKCLGPIRCAEFSNLGSMNLLIGHNGSGKTFLLKALYSSIKSLEAFKRGKEQRTLKEILSDKLHWTFQVNSIGDIVTKGESGLHFSLRKADKVFKFSVGNTASKNISSVSSDFLPSDKNSIFIPAKEIISLRDIILDSRENLMAFGFDDTYYDLAKALRPTTKGRNVKSFSNARKDLENAIGGKIVFDDKSQSWFFYGDNKKKYDISITAEGIKKLSILDSLLGNHYISKGSVIIIDELESNLHPEMISSFLNILHKLSMAGLQFFLSSHSYFVIKNLYLIAQKNHISIPTWSFEKDAVIRCDLLDEMPDNPIINESIRLYKEEISIKL